MERPGEARVRWVAFAASLAIHAALLSLPMSNGAPATPGRAPDSSSFDPALRIVRLDVTPAAAPAADRRLIPSPWEPVASVPVEEEPAAPDLEPPRPPAQTRAEREAGGVTPAGLGTAPNLLPTWNPELHRPLRRSGPASAPPALPDLIRSIEGARVETGRMRIRDGEAFSTWTTADVGEARWGARPGVLVLGGLRVPLCGGDFDAADCGFGLEPALRAAYRLRIRAQNEIRVQQLRGEWADRAEAVRERRDAARDTIR